MTQTPSTSSTAGAQPTQYARPAPPPPPARTGWTGWIVFASIMLLLVGTFQLVAGLVAIFQDQYYVVVNTGLVVHMNYTAWGWTHIGLAAINLLAGFGLLTAKTWARVWAIAVAGLSALANLAFLAASPVWVTIMITLDVLVIYALSVHWDEMKLTR